MNKKEFVTGLQILNLSFSNFNISETVYDFIYTGFKDYDNNLFMEAINNVVTTIDRTPTIAHIHKAIKDIAIRNITDAEKEFDNIKKLVSKYGRYKEEEAYNDMNATTKAVLIEMGGFEKAICDMTKEDVTWRRKEFKELYNIKINRELTNKKTINKLYLRGNQEKNMRLENKNGK